VPSIGGHEPLIKNPITGTYEPAVHGFDYEGTINSARNQELAARIEGDLKIAKENGDSERVRLLTNSANRVAEERVINPRWAMLAKKEDPVTGEIVPFENVKKDPALSKSVLGYWGGPLELKLTKDLSKQEAEDQIVAWNIEQQRASLHLGSWETNYLNPEFEPGMFANPRNVEYRTLGVTNKYHFEKARQINKQRKREGTLESEGKMTEGQVERDYLFGKPVIKYRPKGEEGKRFDADVLAKTLNTANSPEYLNALRAWRKDGLSKQTDYDGKEATTALLYTAPNENKLRLEEEFAADPQNTGTWKTSRHAYAENVGLTDEEKYYNKVEVEPLREGLIEGGDATSVENSIREEKRIWGEYARVRGDERGYEVQ